MEQTAGKEYCQSCGMPLRFDIEEYLGSNADHSHSNEYCYYCLKDGQYIVDIPMSEMVDIWVKYTDKYNWYSGTNYTPQELRIVLNKRLPTLKRWRQKEETRNIHFESLNRIKNHIDQNLFAELDPRQLAAAANLSFYYFRRVFRELTGENIGAYIGRLRLEYIAHLLIASGQSIEAVRLQTNYQTRFSLAKAFKKHFGISMTDYRAKYSRLIEKPAPAELPQAEIRRLNTLKAVCLEAGSRLGRQLYIEAWQELTHCALMHLRQNSPRFISICRDHPFITPSAHRRFYIGVITDKEVEAKGRFSMQEIPGGMYAVFRHKGNYSGLPELYRDIYEQWLPQSCYQLKHPQVFEAYANLPSEIPADELLTEIYIPIEKIK